MNAYITHELARQHQADLMREADRARLAKIARAGKEHDEATGHARMRLALALAGAAAGILATASIVLAR